MQLVPTPSSFSILGPSDFMPPTDLSTTPSPPELDSFGTQPIATLQANVSPTGASATAAINSPLESDAVATASISLYGTGASASASIEGPSITLTAHASRTPVTSEFQSQPPGSPVPVDRTPSSPGLPSPPYASPITQPRSSTPTNLPAPVTPSLPGTGPGQINGLFSETAGIDHDKDEWTELLKRLWPLLQQDLGPEWELCLARFIDYECHCGFKVCLYIKIFFPVRQLSFIGEGDFLSKRLTPRRSCELA